MSGTIPACFTVQDLRGSGSHADFNVRGYDIRGNLLLHTWHIGESCMEMECEAWRSRGAVQRGREGEAPQLEPEVRP
jgi:hypothetical protein